MNKFTLPLYTWGGKISLHMCIPVGADLDVGRVSKVRRAYHLGRDGEAHNIGSTGRAMQQAPRDVFFSIIRDEMMVRSGHLHGNGLRRISPCLSR